MPKRDDKLERDAGLFIQRYGRKKRKGANANDRDYDRRLEKKLKRMDPAELSRLLNADDAEDDDTGQ